MPLNPTLLARLQTVFCEVRVANRDVEGVAQMVRRPGGGVELRVPHWGETYRVRCPFCRETRFRLYINWRYGLPDPSNSGRFRINYLYRCHNGGCEYATPANRAQLAERLLSFRNARERMTLWRSVASAGTASVNWREAPPPGQLVPLTDLAVDHPALDYLMHRGYGVDVMQRFGLSYCVRAESSFRLAESRIICPIDFRGLRIGWQARYVGTPPDRRTPKYYSFPSMPRGSILYNFDQNRQAPFLVVTEGVTDVWRLPDYAVAVLGLDISREQQRLLREFSGGQRPVFLMLDGGAGDQIARFTRELRSTGVQVIPVQLPGELDPGDCPQADLYALLHSAAAQAGFTLDISTAS